ncbi:MAG: CPBP family intramembrane glutamic endopeptidase [Brevirhabdus sp.]
MPSPYAHMIQDFAAPARQRSELWRLLVSAIVFVAAYVGPIMAMFAIAAVLVPADTLMPFLDNFQGGASPWATLLLLFSFVFMIFALWVALRLTHRRGFATLFGPIQAAWRDFRRVLLFLLALQVVFFLLPIGKADMTANLPLATWVLILPVTVLVILIQTGAEELVFRGYLQQQLAARFASPLVWLVGPAILFGLVHYDPETMGENTWIVIGWAALFGLAAGDLTARAGNLGPAIALHFTNNFGAISLVSLNGPLSGLALYKLPYTGADTETLPSLLWVDLAAILVTWLLARVAIRR